MSASPLRVLMCFAVTSRFFELPVHEHEALFEATRSMIRGIRGHDGIAIIGTFDDDQTVIAPTTGWPWTFYLLADAADHHALTSACKLLRTTLVGDKSLSLYIHMEARVGRPVPE